MKARIHENGGDKAFTFRTFLLAATLVVLALIATLGIHATSALAAENENVTDIDVPANETVLVSNKTGPVKQEVTQADYDKLSAQYNVSPDGPNVISSKTKDEQSVETKTDKGRKTRTKATTTWVISGPVKSTPPADNKTENNPKPSLNPLLVAPIAAAVTVPVVAVPTAIITALPAAIVGGIANAIPAALVGGTLAAVPAGIGGAVLNAIPAATVGALANAIPAGLVGGALAAVPAGVVGATLNAIPAALVGGALNAIPAALVGSALTAIPASLVGAGLNALPAALVGSALAVIPSALGGAALAALPNLLKGFNDGFKLGDLVGTLKTIPAALIGAGLNALPAALVGSVLTVLPASILAAIPAFLNGALLGTLATAAVVGPLSFINGFILGNVLGKLVAFPAGVIAGVVPTAILGVVLGTGAVILAAPIAFGLGALLAKTAFDFFVRNPLILLNLGLGLLVPLAFLAGLLPGALLLGALPLIKLGAAIPAALLGSGLGALANLVPAAILGGLLTAVPAALAALTLGRLALGTLGALHALANPLSFGGPLFKILKGNLFPLAEILKDHLEDLIVPFLAGGVLPTILGLGALTLGLPAVLLAAPLVALTGALLGAPLLALPFVLLKDFFGLGVYSLAVRLIAYTFGLVGVFLANPLFGLQAVPVFLSLVLGDFLLWAVRTIEGLAFATSVLSSKLFGVSLLGRLILGVASLVALVLVPVVGLIDLVTGGLLALLAPLDVFLPIKLLWPWKLLFDAIPIVVLLSIPLINFGLGAVEVVVALSSLGTVPALLLAANDLILVLLDDVWAILDLNPLTSLLALGLATVNTGFAVFNWLIATGSFIKGLLAVDAWLLLAGD